MKLEFFVLLLFFITIGGCAQQPDSSITPSSWIGKVKMGDANPEVIFNIFKDSLGQIAGNLDVPSKGIQGITLSRVHIEEDSITLESSAAQLIYKGVFKKDGNTIVGKWIEPHLNSPLTLQPLNKTIDYYNYKPEKISSLNLELEGEHFNFYSKKADSTVLKNISNVLESNYLGITKNMKTSFESKIDVFIYPDVQSFHNAINVPDAPDWVVGAAGKNELKMVSPLNPGKEHTYESLMKAIVHEFTHTVVLNFRKQGLTGLPKWLNEGYAYYEAKQLTESQRELIHNLLLNDKIPSWNELEKADDYQFGNINGYPISAAIIEFLVESYGLDKLKQFIKDPKKVEKIYNMSKEDLEILCLKHLKQD